MSIIPVDNFNRDLSSSEDQCKCPSCKNQDDIRLAKRTLCTLYSYRHKKR